MTTIQMPPNSAAAYWLDVVAGWMAVVWCEEMCCWMEHDIPFGYKSTEREVEEFIKEYWGVDQVVFFEGTSTCG